MFYLRLRSIDMKKAILGAVCVMAILLTSDLIAAAEPMSIATSEWPPYGYLENRKAVGFATEVLGKVLPKLGVEHKFEFMPWKRAIEIAEAGEADAVYSASYNAERAEFLLYPETPLHASEYVFFIRKSDVGKLKFDTLDDLKDHKVGVTRGYSYSDELLKKLDELENSDEADSDELNFEKLNGGRIDYFPADLLNGLALLKKMGMQDKLTYLDTRIKIKDYFIAFSKKSPKISEGFVKKFSDELKSFTQTDDYKGIHDKYYPKVHHHTIK
jgi:polar amino acid transport system substrate-binding protein